MSALLACLPSIYAIWRSEFVIVGKHDRMLGGPEVASMVVVLMLISIALGLLGLNSQKRGRWAIFLLTMLTVVIADHCLTLATISRA